MIKLEPAVYVKSAGKSADFIRDDRPMVVFAGKSNVGKSSVINCLLNRKNLARVGSAPGKTTNVNYFLVGDAVWFVDLPGYGAGPVGQAHGGLLRRERAHHLRRADTGRAARCRGCSSARTSPGSAIYARSSPYLTPTPAAKYHTPTAVLRAG